ncbi:phage head-tail connector protein [Maridesulfovibrio ferrireducens]|uniref:head-tail connector protein n=1 Tax=Maridesulfovibrio ferrireducens TaxID=246191 RepID=UPI001A2AA7FE|nr:phage head-tail connector protein [Maridesulfovibrio ferrireducens]MBI9110287.1 phage head-tail connector protein [Maridesulfovibrio ferrireducens]
MSLKLIARSDTEQVTLEEAKKHLRLSPDFVDHDDKIKLIISAARAQGEAHTHRVWNKAQFELRCHGFPSRDGVLELPLPPLCSVESVKYIDNKGVETVLPVESYQVDVDSMVGSIYPAFEQTWPEVRAERFAVRVAFTAGYENFPPALQQWMLVRIADYYANPESVIVDTQSINKVDISDVIDGLLDPFIIPVVA